MFTSVFPSLELPESSGYRLSLCSKRETSYPKGPWKKGKHFRSKVSSLIASKAPKPESLQETNLHPSQTLRSAEPTGRSRDEEGAAKMVGGLWKDTSCLGLHCPAREFRHTPTNCSSFVNIDKLRGERAQPQCGVRPRQRRAYLRSLILFSNEFSGSYTLIALFIPTVQEKNRNARTVHRDGTLK